MAYIKNAHLLRARSVIAFLAVGALAACGGGVQNSAVPPISTVSNTSPSDSLPGSSTGSPLVADATTTTHYFDDTGCKDFPSNDYWNRSVASAKVSGSSPAEINYAYSQYRSAPVFAPPYKYQVVPVGSALYSVDPRSSHRIPANYEMTLKGWPIPSDMSSLLGTADKVSVLLQETSPPSDCRGWDGYDFAGRNTSYSAFSGDHVEMDRNMPTETCNGVAQLCGEDLEGDLTYYELNSGKPILHAIHAEFPCSIAGTCGYANRYSFNQRFGCADSCARLRLNTAKVRRPSNPQAAALYDAMAHYGLDTSENGGYWTLYTLQRDGDSAYPMSIPPAVSGFISTLRLTDFEVLQNGSW
ncbi:MAG TPA: hypothetical protein VKT72_04930 [Candidatus Baltobacteraceae bacterium]|nr:hypothetical protein [Candidatus Baltobacteraceae bacterium]